MTPFARNHSSARPLVSRRALLGAALGATSGVVLLAARPAGVRALTWPVAPGRPAGPAAWRTWLLAAPGDLRPSAPAAPTDAEAAELLALQEQRTDAEADAVAFWGTGPALLPWTALTLDLIKTHKPTPPRAARALALLHVALYDATVAALDARAANRRPAPSEAVVGLRPLDPVAAADSRFGSLHAAVAGAAEVVLPVVFPAEPTDRLRMRAAEAAHSRLVAGASYRSDVEAGLALGRAVGERAVERARADGADAVWNGARPAGPGVWQPTPPGFVDPPLEPLAGTWQPWVIPSVVQVRPGPPPAYGSPAFAAELAAVKEAVAGRTPGQAAAAEFWAGGPGTVTPAGQWIERARDLIVRDRLDDAHAARVLALAGVALHDAFVCCWDAKYAYWLLRPITADPTLDVLIPTPPFPSYTSGHSTISFGAAAILGHLFPADKPDLHAWAAEARDSRPWAGIHYPIDNEMGATMGGAVGRLVADLARHDGAE